MSVRKTAELCIVSRGSVSRIGQETLEEKSASKNKTTILRQGRPRKLTDKQGRLLLRCMALDCMMKKEILQNVSWQVADLLFMMCRCVQ